MKPIGKSKLLISVLLLSGCFQEEAPRHETRAAVTAVAVRQLAADQQSIQARKEEGSATVPQLATLLQEESDPEIRREALYLIADAGEVDDAALIGQALYDPDSQVRKAAVEALTGIGGEASADWMLVALGDPDPHIRQSAVEALGEIGGDTAGFLLRQALADVDQDVRAAAQQMLDEPRSKHDLR